MAVFGADSNRDESKIRQDNSHHHPLAQQQAKTLL